MYKQRKKAFEGSCLWNFAVVIVAVSLASLVFACKPEEAIPQGHSVVSDTDSQQKAISAGSDDVSQGSVPSDTSEPDSDATEAKAVSADIPRLVDLGAETCIPCKMMAPILQELKEEYAGRLEVEFIDVRKNPDAVKQYGVRLIPTQIFYDANGDEFYRHEGFFSRDDILSVFKEKGIDLSI